MNSWDVAGLTANLGDHNIRTTYEVKHVERRIKRLVRHKGFDFSTLVRKGISFEMSFYNQFVSAQRYCLAYSR